MAAYKDSYESGPGSMGMPRLTPVVRTLLWVNIALALVGLLFVERVSSLRAAFDWLALDPARWRESAPLVPIWQVFTYGFLHSTVAPSHILWNMLGLFFFGTALESAFGSRRFACFYVLGIVLPGIAQLVFSLATGESTPVVGASGAILALVVGLATLQPHALVYFILIPLKLWVLASIYVALDLVGLAQSSGNVAHFVHLVGAAFGFVVIKTGWIWIDPAEKLRRRRETKVVENAQNDEEKLDQLLERIHREGIGSLSEREKEFLKRMSSRKTG